MQKYGYDVIEAFQSWHKSELFCSYNFDAEDHALNCRGEGVTPIRSGFG